LAKPRAIAAGLAPALLLVIVSAWEIYATRADATSVPDDDAWRAAEKLVRAEYQPGDLIVFAPEWVDPVGRLHLGDLITIRDAARMDAAKYARVWELSIRGARAPETAALSPARSADAGGIAVRRYDQRPAKVLADVRDLVPAGGGRRVLAEVGFAPHDCIEVVPAPNQPVRIVLPSVPLGTKLVGYAGLADVFTRRDIRAPGKLAVEIGGATAATVEPGVDDGWVRFEIETRPGPADVVFVVSAGAPNRHVCFAAEARE
jgi:hypothetical protein